MYLMNSGIDLIDLIDHSRDISSVLNVENRPCILRDQLTFSIERHGIVPFRKGRVVELRQQTRHDTRLRFPNEVIYKEVRFDSNRDDKHLNQESQIATIRILEFLSLRSKQTASCFSRIVSIINEEIHFTVHVVYSKLHYIKLN